MMPQVVLLAQETIQSGSSKVVIDVNKGGRVHQLFFGDHPLIFDGHEELAGSVWWPAPQTLWGWPPPKELDIEAYHLKEKTPSKVVVESKECSALGLQLTKEYQLITEHHFQVKYHAKNVSDKSVEFGHWEVSRVPKEGRVIVKVESRFDDNIPLANDKYLYFDHSSFDKIYSKEMKAIDFYVKESDLELPYKNKNKLFVDSEGWVAYVKDTTVFIKIIKNENIKKITPSQGEVEIYVSPILPMVEIEEHSAYQKVKPKETSTWKVDWLMYQISEEDKANVLEWIEGKIKDFKAIN